MTNKELKFCKEVYERMLEGTYNPIELQQTYILIAGVDEPVAIRRKKQTLYAFMNTQYPELIKDNPEIGNGLFGDNQVTLKEMEEEGLTPFTNEYDELIDESIKENITKAKRGRKKNDGHE